MGVVIKSSQWKSDFGLQMLVSCDQDGPNDRLRSYCDKANILSDSRTHAIWSLYMSANDRTWFISQVSVHKRI